MPNRPFTAVPATRSSARSLKVKQYLIIGALLFGFLLGPLAFWVASSTSSKIPKVPAQTPTQAIAFGEIIAYDFLAARTTTLPAAEGVDREFSSGPNPGPAFDYSELTFDKVDTNAIADRTVYDVRFRVAADKVVYNLTVPVILDSRGRSLLAAQPSMTRAVFAPDGEIKQPIPLDDPGYTDDVPAAVVERVAQWAQYFAADNRDQLKVLVGGGAAAPDGQYIGLGGFSFSGRPAVPWGVVKGDSAWVRVDVVFQPTGANKFVASMSYDLLISQYSTADPRVVAWGPAGSGPTLTPYQNNTANL